MQIQELIKRLEENLITIPSGHCPFCKSTGTIVNGLHPKDAIEHYGYYNFAIYELKDSLLRLAVNDLNKKAEELGKLILELQKLQLEEK